jgi:hypothetical protein
MHDPGFRTSEDSICLRSLGYRDRQWKEYHYIIHENPGPCDTIATFCVDYISPLKCKSSYGLVSRSHFIVQYGENLEQSVLSTLNHQTTVSHTNFKRLRLSCEANSGLSTQEIPSILSDSNDYYNFHMSPSLVLILSQMNPVRTTIDPTVLHPSNIQRILQQR